MRNKIRINTKWKAGDSHADAADILATVFARVLRPEVFKVRKDAETALAAANKLISAGDRTFKNQKTKTMKRIEVLEAELAKLRVSMVDDH